MNATADLVLVHGLFYGRASMALLGRRLGRRAFRVRYFGYQPTRSGLDRAATELGRYVRRFDASAVHLVGHSFGGLVILQALEGDRGLPPGRAVLLGSPLQGSSVARRLLRIAPGRALLRAAGPALARGFAHLPPGREVGLIAGDTGLGLGRLTGVHLGPSDGTVGVNEAYADGLAGRLVAPVSHTGMLLSRAVSEQVTHFLHHGAFRAPEDSRQ